MLLRDKSIENQTIALRSGDVTGLGPGSALVNCVVEAHITSRELVLTDVEMRNCTFVAKKQITGYRFLRVRFYDCEFAGAFSGCDFGKRAENYDGLGDIANCDFSRAKLDGCRFFNCDFRSLTFSSDRKLIVVQFPLDPAIVLDLKRLSAGLRAFANVLLTESPECVAIVDDLELSAQRLNVEAAELQNMALDLGAKTALS